MSENWPSNDKLGEYARIDGDEMKRLAAGYQHTAEWAVDVPTYLGTFTLGASAFGVTTVIGPDFYSWDYSRVRYRYSISWASWGQKVAIEAGIELMGYAVGEVRTFETPVDLSFLTPFTQDVLRAVQTVPYGTTITVAQLAQLAGHPRKVAPVLRAVRFNPAPIFVPCHRIVPTTGGTGDWSGIPGFKQGLLALEGVEVRDVLVEA
ncbi:MAG: methylated-DNA--[protein]-cysteine S-methyltransferase [Myxococcota bacterium]|jgi:O-6-methylguanine DNA methyltransferase|nr:methylated-DNA--[protein]-cysteine S-methyltransferase [Myxococcota bacterium]